MLLHGDSYSFSANLLLSINYFHFKNNLIPNCHCKFLNVSGKLNKKYFY